jgi:hypothetical protein
MENLNRNTFVLSLIFTLSIWSLTGQTTNKMGLANYEKVFVQTDKNQFTAGDIINYATFLYPNQSGPETYLSTLIYYELNDWNGKSCLKWQQSLIANRNQGQQRIPDNLPVGVYTLRAFTYAFSNLPEHFCFSSPLIITNYSDDEQSSVLFNRSLINNALITYKLSNESDSARIKTTIEVMLHSNIDIGDVVFEIWDSYKLVATTEPDFFNKGRLSFFPQTDQEYKLIVKRSGYSDRIIEIGNPLTNQINATESKTSGLVDVDILPDFTNKLPAKLRLKVASQEIDWLDSTIFVNQDIAKFTIANQRFKYGYNKFILTDAQNQVRSTFYYFNPLSEKIKVNIPEKGFKIDEKVNLNLDLSDLNPNDSTVFSVTLSQLNTLDSLFPVTSLERHLFLTSETGFISSKDAVSSTKIENMLWEQPDTTVLTKLKHKEHDFKIIEGKVLNEYTKEPLKHANIVAAYCDNSANFKQIFTDSSGNFRFLFDSLWSDKIIYLQVLGSEYVDKKVIWQFAEPDQNVKVTKSDSLELDEYEVSAFKDLRKRSLVNRVYFSQQVKPVAPNNDSVPSFYFTPGKVIYPGEYYPLNNFEDICSNIIPGVRMNKTKNGYSFSIVINDNQTVSKDNILILLNGVPFQNINYVSLLSSASVKRIDVINNVFMYGHLKYNGAIGIYLTEDELKDEWFNNPVCLYTNYSNQVIASQKPKYDQLNPIVGPCYYWDPCVFQQGRSTIQLPIGRLNVAGKYMLTISGINRFGEPVSLVKSFVVNP